MAREIKFRAWDKVLNKMIEIKLFRFESPILVKDLELMQFTGLLDKNGKEIYEGDIVECGGYITEVVWNIRFSSFCLRKDGWMFDHFFGEAQEPEDSEVIGNIYENPELLEAKP